MELLAKITQIAIVLIGFIHAGLAIGEIFFGAWLLEQRFDFPSDIAVQADRIVKNAGIYNSFIAAGLFWAAFDPTNSTILSIFFLSCVVIAGVFGAITLRWTTLLIQTFPAIIPLILIWLGNK
jgi:putative membrane protein